MKKVFAYIDGFNVYHSLFTFIKNNNREEHYLKWIDYKKLLHIFIDPSQETLEKIYFFTAPPKHLLPLQYPKKIERHEHYMRALQEYLDITVISGRFGKKTIRCAKCKESTVRHEEKETDVSIGIQVVHDILKESQLPNKCLLASGNSIDNPYISCGNEG